jgi:hypothetical protein
VKPVQGQLTQYKTQYNQQSIHIQIDLARYKFSRQSVQNANKRFKNIENRGKD